MDGYLSKPIEPELLFAVVEARAETGAAPAAVLAHVLTPTFDEEALLTRVLATRGLMADVIAVFLEDCPLRLAAISDAVSRRDAEALRLAAHALKGAPRTCRRSGCSRRRGCSNGSRLNRTWRQPKRRFGNCPWKPETCWTCCGAARPSRNWRRSDANPDCR